MNLALAGLGAGLLNGLGQGLQQQHRDQLELAKEAALEAREMRMLKFRDSLTSERDQKNYETEQTRQVERASKANEIASSVVDPMEGKGGYEDEASMAKRQYSLLEQRAAKLEEAGFTPEADRIYSKLKNIDGKNSKESQLEIKKMMLDLQGQRNEDLAKYQTGLLGNAVDKIKMQGEVNAAKIEAAQSKVSVGRAPTSEQTKLNIFLQAYGDNPEFVNKGKLTQKGYEKFNKTTEQDTYDEVTEKTFEGDKEITKKSKVPRGVNPQPVAVYQKGKGLVFK